MFTFTKEKMTFIVKWVLGLEELNIKQKELFQGRLTELLQIKETQDESFFPRTKSILDKIEKESPNLLPNLKAGKIKNIIEENLILIKEELKPEFQNYEEEIKEKSTLFDIAIFLWEVHDDILTKSKAKIKNEKWNPPLKLKEINKIEETTNIRYLEDLHESIEKIRECPAEFEKISINQEQPKISKLIKELEAFPQEEDENYPKGLIYQINKEKIDGYLTHLKNLQKLIEEPLTCERKLEMLFIKAESAQTEASIESVLKELKNFNTKKIKKRKKENYEKKIKTAIIRLGLRLVIKKEENREEVLQTLKNYRANEKETYQLENKDNELDELITNLTEEKLQEILTQAKNPNLKIIKILSLKTEIENFKNGDAEQQKVFQKLNAQSVIDKLCLKIEENERKNALKKARKSAKKGITETRELNSVTLEQLNKYLEEKKITNDFDNYVNNIKKVEEINNFKKLVLEEYIPEIKQEKITVQELVVEVNSPNLQEINVDEKLNFIGKNAIISKLEDYRQKDKVIYEKEKAKSLCEKEFKNLIEQISKTNLQEIPVLWWKIGSYINGNREQREIYNKYNGKALLKSLVTRENLLKKENFYKQEKLEVKIEIPLKKE